jgi:hypothetical protein
MEPSSDAATTVYSPFMSAAMDLRVFDTRRVWVCVWHAVG